MAVVSILIAVAAVVLVLGGALYLLNEVGTTYVPPAFDLFPSVSFLGAVILMVLGVALLALATSLWRQETWALWSTLVLVFGTTLYLFFTESITALFVLLVILFVPSVGAWQGQESLPGPAGRRGIPARGQDAAAAELRPRMRYPPSGTDGSWCLIAVRPGPDRAI